MKILNLDTFATVKRQLVLAGKTHDIPEVSVQAFIDNLKAAEEMDAAAAVAGKEAPLSTQVENSIAAILSSIPSLVRDDVAKLPVEALSAIMKFIRGEMDAGEGAEGGAEKKPS
jgi:hypothetical protein